MTFGEFEQLLAAKTVRATVLGVDLVLRPHQLEALARYAKAIRPE